MMDSLVKSIESTFVQFSIGRLLYVVFVLGLAVAALYIFNGLTGYTRFQRINSEISAIERLHGLEKGGIRASELLNPIYESILEELYAGEDAFALKLSSAPILKFISASGIALLFIIVGLIHIAQGKSDGRSMVTGATVFAAILGFPAVLVPTLGHIWVNIGINALVQILAFVMLQRWNLKKSRQLSSV